MQSTAKTPEEYIDSLPDDRQVVIEKLRQTITANLPEGFKEGIGYGMLCYSVPHTIYPAGYHCDPKLPLPFISVASQKNFIALYHMGLYADKELLDWFVSEYPKHAKHKLDMGKSCIRFKKPDDMPISLIAELVKKITVEQWIDSYESAFRKH